MVDSHRGAEEWIPAPWVRLSNTMWSVERSSRRLRTARMLVHEVEKQDNLLLSYTYVIKEKKEKHDFLKLETVKSGNRDGTRGRETGEQEEQH